jgi:drug/metabolite transporter (DMT)-like permease
MLIWPYLALAAAGSCWGLGLPFGKIALGETDAAHMILLRFAVAALAVLPVALRNAKSRSLFANPAVLAAGACYAVGFLVQFEGLARASVAVSALLVGVMPALIAVAAAIGGDRIGRLSWLGVFGATLGAALIAGRPGAHVTTLGVILCLVSLPVFLGWIYAARHAPKSASSVDVSCVAIIVAALVLLPLVWVMHGPPRLNLSPIAWGGIIGQGLLSTVVATIAWQLGSPRVSSAAAGVFINIEPLVGTGLGMALFHDRPTVLAGLGGVMILGGSLVTVLGEHTDRHQRLTPSDAATPA